MNQAIVNALNYLNELEIRGERNCVLLASAIRELKPLVNQADPLQVPNHESNQP